MMARRRKETSKNKADAHKQPPADAAWHGLGLPNQAWLPHSDSVNQDLPQGMAAAATPSGLAPLPTALATPQYLQLRGLSGADAHVVFALDHADIQVGRAKTCDLVLLDASVSREHARLLVGHSQVEVVDLGSGNGSFINGKPIQRAMAVPGDELCFGRAVFVLTATGLSDQVKPSQSPRQQEALLANLQKTSFRALFWRGVAMLLVGLLMFAVGALGAFKFQVHNVQRRIQQDNEIFALYTQGVMAFKKQDWPTSQSYFAAALTDNPQHARIKHYLKVIEREKIAQTQWLEAQSYRAKNNLWQASNLAQGILDSTYRPQAQALLQNVEAEINAKILQAERLLAAQRYAEALQLLGGIELLQPGRPDLLSLLLQINLKVDSQRLVPASLAERLRLWHVPHEEAAVQVARKQLQLGNRTAALQSLEDINSEQGAALRYQIEQMLQAADVLPP